MESTCSIEECNLTANYYGKCALHCDKGDYPSDYRKGILSDFYDQLVEYILKEIFLRLDENEADKELKIELQGGGIEWPKEKLEKIQERKNIYLNQIKSDENNPVLEALKYYPIVFQGIVFPEHKSRDYFDFFKLFKKFEGIHFDISTINFGSFNLANVKSFFQDCIFINDWSIHTYSILEDVVSKTLFKNCKFEGVVSTAPEENSRDVLKIEHHLFNDCEFKEPLLIKRGEITTSIFNNSEGYEQVLNYLHITGGEFKARFILNRVKIKILEIRDVEFQRKFELKESDIQNTNIYNVNFHKLFDAYKTEFNNFKISRSIFYDFTGFEKCKFGFKYENSSQATEFEYVTFFNFSNFRKAKFYNGLDFEHTNLKEPLNFLNAYINPKNTNRETYRIIKHSFEKVGNQIEANSCFSTEMKAYEVELTSHIAKTKKSLCEQKFKHRLECKKFDEISVSKLNALKEDVTRYRNELFIYRLNRIFSNFGQSYIQPLILMIMSTFLYLAACCAVANGCFEWTGFVGVGFNDFARVIPPYGRFLQQGTAFITLFYHIFFLACTWQFIVAVKRRTKR